MFDFALYRIFRQLEPFPFPKKWYYPPAPIMIFLGFEPLFLTISNDTSLGKHSDEDRSGAAPCRSATS